MKLLRRPLCLAACLTAALLALLGALIPDFAVRVSLYPYALTDPALTGPVEITGQVSALTESEERLSFRMTHVRDAAGRDRLPDVVVYWQKSAPSMPSGAALAGRLVRLRGEGASFERAVNPGQFDAAAYYAVRGVGWKLTSPILLSLTDGPSGAEGAVASLRFLLRQRIVRYFPDETAGPAASLVIGDKSLMEADDKRLWQMTGLSHMLAVSGMHVTLAAAGAEALLRRLRARPGTARLMTLPPVLLYVALTGFSISAFRAFCLYLYDSGAVLSGRRKDPLNGLSLAVLLILASNPGWLFDASFQFSVGAVLLLILLSRMERRRSALVFYLAMLPLTARSFCEVPLLSLAGNALLLPFLPVLLLLCLIGAVFGGAAALPAVWGLRGAAAFLSLLARFPRLTLITGCPGIGQMLLYEGLLAGACFTGHRLKRFGGGLPGRGRFLLRGIRTAAAGLFLLLLLLVLCRPPARDMTVTCLDVGQGDCTLIEMPGGGAVLVDGGSSSVNEPGRYRILPCLLYKGIRRLDYLAVTHPDEDHINGIREILTMAASRQTSLSVSVLLMPDLLPGTPEREALEALADLAAEAGTETVYTGRGDRLVFEGRRTVTLEVLSPRRRTAYESANAASLVLAVRDGLCGVLLTGDAEGSGEEELTALLENTAGSFALLKAAHHGSRGSTSAAFLDAVKPAAAVISAGRNVYGHPHAETLMRLAEAGTEVFITRESGAVEAVSSGRDLALCGFVREKIR